MINQTLKHPIKVISLFNRFLHLLSVQDEDGRPIFTYTYIHTHICLSYKITFKICESFLHVLCIIHFTILLFYNSQNAKTIKLFKKSLNV